MDAADALERGAELIAERGWTRHYYETDAGQLCYLGSLRRALHEEHPHHAVWEMNHLVAFRVAFRASADYLGRSASRWNDNVATSAEEVVDTMKLIAKDLRNRAEPA